MKGIGLQAPQPLVDMHVRRKEDCFEINTGRGEKIYELSGLSNPPKSLAEEHSIALVEITPGGGSEAHFHPEAEESYICMAGTGKLVINGETFIVTPGSIVKIDPNVVHPIFNEPTSPETLIFYCVCAPAWRPEGSKPASDAPSMPESEQKICARRIEECPQFPMVEGVAIRALLGVEQGAKKHSVAQIEIVAGKSIPPLINPATEESYIITAGQGRLLINGQERVVTAGDTVFIPKGGKHQIFNNGTELLQFFAICAPPWTPQTSIVAQ